MFRLANSNEKHCGASGSVNVCGWVKRWGNTTRFMLDSSKSLTAVLAIALDYEAVNMPTMLALEASYPSCRIDVTELQRRYFWKALSKADWNYCIIKRELLSVVRSIEHAIVVLMRVNQNHEGQVTRWSTTLSRAQERAIAMRMPFRDVHAQQSVRITPE